MALRYVRQKHEHGCFYAGLAMLLGVSYEQAFKRVHPHLSTSALLASPLLAADQTVSVLQRLGIKHSPAKARRVRSLRHNALIVVRWTCAPNVSHTFVYDADERRLLDPGSKRRPWVSDIERQIYSVTYIHQ